MDGGPIPSEMDRHFWLTRSMARVAGVNLTRAMAEGGLSADDYVRMIERCQTSGCETACAVWLAAQTDWPATPPPFCAHVEILARLGRRQAG